MSKIFTKKLTTWNTYIYLVQYKEFILCNFRVFLLDWNINVMETRKCYSVFYQTNGYISINISTQNTNWWVFPVLKYYNWNFAKNKWPYGMCLIHTMSSAVCNVFFVHLIFLVFFFSLFHFCFVLFIYDFPIISRSTF